MDLSRNICEQISHLPLKIKKKLHINHQSKVEDINYINSSAQQDVRRVTTIFFGDWS